MRVLALALLLAACGDNLPDTARDQCELVLSSYCEAVATCGEIAAEDCFASIGAQCDEASVAMPSEDVSACAGGFEPMACALRGGYPRPVPNETQRACVGFFADQGGL